jgi:hypothetical protein
MRKKIKEIKFKYNLGNRLLNDSFHINADVKSQEERNKKPLRTDIINFLLASLNKEDLKYLEIGVNNPEDNFNKINSKFKYGVDPGIDFKANPVDFKMTSDEFFNQIRSGKILYSDIKFDVIFIDGLHLADQVEKDIKNSLDFIRDDGFIVMHDCNPPTEFHARESFYYEISPAKGSWNGTTWKAFFKLRQSLEVYSCCVNSDWGVGVISKKINLGKPTTIENPFFEYSIFTNNRIDSLNLIDFECLKKMISAKL